MNAIKFATKVLLITLMAIAVGVPLFALPATLSLPRGRRPGIESLTISQAADRLRASGRSGWDLVEAARFLVADRMQYGRRNSYEPAPIAFSRGYGYCQQMSFALTDLLLELGFDAKVVQSLQNRFPDGSFGGHAWVSVTIEGQTRHIDAYLWDGQNGRLDFTPLAKITEVGPLFRLFAGWGAPAVNAYRYYKTGADS